MRAEIQNLILEILNESSFLERGKRLFLNDKLDRANCINKNATNYLELLKEFGTFNLIQRKHQYEWIKFNL